MSIDMDDIKKPEEIDNEYTDEIVCPYCGREESDSWEYSDDDGQAACGYCGAEFLYERHTSVHYSTERADCLNGLAEHAWRQMIGAPAKYFENRERCSNCYTEREKKLDN